jgi:ribosomal protein L32
LSGVWGVSPNPKFPQDWGIKGVEKWLINYLSEYDVDHQGIQDYNKYQDGRLTMPAKKGSEPEQSRKGTPKLQKCPACGEMTLFWDKCTNQGVCLNPNCKLSGR